MSNEELIKRYIVITTTILLCIISAFVCWLFQLSWEIVFLFAYLFGVANGMFIIGVMNYDE